MTDMTPPASFRQVVITGLKKGFSGYLWLLKILVPISFFTMLLVTSGWIQRLDAVLGPVMGLLGLPSTAVIPLLVALLAGIYGGIAAMAALPLTVVQMTLMAVFMLIAHNLIQESAVQDRAGLSFVKSSLLRLAAAVLTVALIARLLPDGGGVMPDAAMASSVAISFRAAILGWLTDTLVLAAKIFLILMPLMVFLEVMKQYHAIERVVRLLGPLLRLLGIERRLGLLWLTAAMFGLAYGAAVIVEEARDGDFQPEHLEDLHVSIGINHAVVEDPALFLPFGIHPFWLWVPRLIAAILAVHMVRWGRRMVKGSFR